MIIIAGNETCLFWTFSIKNITNQMEEIKIRQLNDAHVFLQNKKKGRNLSVSWQQNYRTTQTKQEFLTFPKEKYIHYLTSPIPLKKDENISQS